MKKLVAILSLISISLSAQNYQLARTNTESFYYYYPYGSLEITGIRPDSFALSGNDTILYHYRTMHVGNADTSGCWPMDFAYPTWQGIKTIVKPGGLHVNFSLNGDSIFIDAQAALGQVWNMYTFANGNLVKATVSSVQTETVNTFVDIVKTITLTVTNSGGTGIVHPLNGSQVKISQNGGWYESLNWRDFPNDTSRYVIEPAKRLTYYDVYDFNVGDKLDKQGSSCGGPPGENHYTILSKSGSVVYTVLDTMYQMTYTGGNPPYQWQLTGVPTYTWNLSNSASYLFGNYMPEQVMGYNSSFPQAIPYPYKMTRHSNVCGTYYSEQTTNYDAYYYDTAALCYKSTFEPVYTIFIYTQHRMVDYISYSAQTNCYSTTNTIYFYDASNGTSCGTHNVYGVEEKEIKLSVYPNPAQERLIIETEHLSLTNVRLRVTDVLGREVKVVTTIAQDRLVLDVGSLPRGIYNLHAQIAQRLYSYSFVKE